MEKEQDNKEIQFEVKGVSSEDRLWAAIGYIPPLFILTLILMKDKKFVFAHGKQALMLAIVLFVSLFLNVVPFLGTVVFVFVLFMLGIVWLVALLCVLGGKERAPLLATLADRLPL